MLSKSFTLCRDLVPSSKTKEKKTSAWIYFTGFSRNHWSLDRFFFHGDTQKNKEMIRNFLILKKERRTDE